MDCYRPYWTFVEEGFQPQQSFMIAHFQIKHLCANNIRNTIMLSHDIWKASSHSSIFCWSGLPASTVFHVFMCKHDPQYHKVVQGFMKGYQPYSTFVTRASSLNSLTCLPIHTLYIRAPHRNNVLVWFREGYQPYSTFVEEGFQPQQSYMFAHLYIIHSCAKRIRIAIMFLYDLGRATSHIQHLLKRASCFNFHSRSLMLFSSHCGILPKQLIVSVMTKYWISWLSRKTPEIYTTATENKHKN